MLRNVLFVTILQKQDFIILAWDDGNMAREWGNFTKCGKVGMSVNFKYISITSSLHLTTNQPRTILLLNSLTKHASNTTN